MITYILLASTAISGYDPGVDYDRGKPGYLLNVT